MLTNCLAACAHLTITVSEIARYWSKIVIFSHPLAFDALVRGVPVGISPPRSVRKNRIMWLPDCENFFEDIFIRFDASHERDRQTDRHRMPTYTALMHMHRAVTMQYIAVIGRLHHTKIILLTFRRSVYTSVYTIAPKA